MCVIHIRSGAINLKRPNRTEKLFGQFRYDGWNITLHQCRSNALSQKQRVGDEPEGGETCLGTKENVKTAKQMRNFPSPWKV